LKNKLHILKSELPEDGQQLRPKDVGGLTNKSFVQEVCVKFYICLTGVYVIKDNINAFNKTLTSQAKQCRHVGPALCTFVAGGSKMSSSQLFV